MRFRRVKWRSGGQAVSRSGVILILLASCGPSPRPATPTAVVARDPEAEIISDSLRVQWDVNAGSGSRAGVLFSDSAVFLGTTNRQLLAFSTRSGRKLWDQRLVGEIPDQVVQSGRTLYFVTSEARGRVYARDMERGRKVWHRTIGPARFTPLVEGGIVYVGSDAGQVQALRSEDGDEIWHTRVGGAVSARPLSIGDNIVVVSGTDSVYVIGKRDGSVVRKASTGRELSAQPIMSGETIILPTQSGALLGFNVTTLQESWRVDTGAPILAAPILTKDGSINVLNRSGELWRVRNGRGEKMAQVGNAVTGSFSVARERFVIGEVDGTLYVTDLNGRIIASHRFNEGIYAPATIANHAIYVSLARGRIVKLQ